MNTSSKIFSMFKRSIVIVLLISIATIIFNCLSSSGIPIITPFRVITVGDNLTKFPVFQTRNQIQTYNQKNDFHSPEEIGLDIAYNHFQNYSAIFIDTRSTEEYKKGHISRAVSIPLDALDFNREILPELSRDERLISYCDGEDCSQSIDMAIRLSEIGFNDIYFFFGGWTEWKKAGYPITTGEMP